MYLALLSLMNCLIFGSMMSPAMVNGVDGSLYRPAMTHATLNGDSYSFSPTMAAILDPVIFLGRGS